MLEIQLQGLNKQQVAIADMIWACGTKKQVDALIQALPTKKMKRDAETIVQMMIMATIEQCYDGLGSLDQAQEVLRKYNTKNG